MTELEEGAFDCQKQNGRGGINADLDTDDRQKGSRRDVLGRQELRDEMDGELLHEIRTVGSAGDERGAWNRDPPEREGLSRRDIGH